MILHYRKAHTGAKLEVNAPLADAAQAAEDAAEAAAMDVTVKQTPARKGKTPRKEPDGE